ncbi:MAG: diguanylate cyclase, partial [Acidobacteriales bacterium]|nr:diguanylate cyclase [Terriglobales bacterium]
ADDYLTKPFHVDELRARVRAGKRILELQDALVRAHGAVQFAADHDPLTRLWNRGAILSLLERELRRGLRTSAPVGVIMADVDYFKNINDRHGHLIGDAVLQETATRLASAVRSYDSVGRYGGEEFLIIVPGCNERAAADSGERLRNCIAALPVETSAGAISVTLSVGVMSVHPEKDLWQRDDLIRAADIALYRAKASGRNRVESSSTLLAAPTLDP